MSGVQIPNTLQECFDYLNSIITFEDLEKITSGELEPVQLHFDLGRWIRNNWGLWTGTGLLYEYLSSIGLQHADDMSNMILEAYFALLNEQPYDIEAYVLKCKQYWKDNA